MPLIVERLADHLLSSLHHEVGHLGADRIDRLLALGLDVASRVLDDSAGVLLGSGAQLCPQLVGGAAGALDDSGRLSPGFLELPLGEAQAVLRLVARPFGGGKLLADLSLAPRRPPSPAGIPTCQGQGSSR